MITDFLPSLSLRQRRPGGKHRFLLWLWCAVLLLLLFGGNPGTLSAQTYTKQTLYSFGGSMDGTQPSSGLIAVGGKFYGTTQNGGINGVGTIFSIDPATGTEKILYSFGDSLSDGEYPLARLLNVYGVLYGTTSGGGNGGTGTIFRFDIALRTETVLYSFSSMDLNGINPDGAKPENSLIAVAGKLYGVAFQGGSAGDGTVFSLDLNTFLETTLHSFQGGPNDGSGPLCRLTNLGAKLYGTTLSGGGSTSNDGTIFSLNLDGSGYQLLYSFAGKLQSDGSIPESLIEVSGVLYGTTYGGGTNNAGTVFAFDPAARTETVLFQFHPFDAANSGGNPNGDLIEVNGTLFGDTFGGGSDTHGTVYSLNLDGTNYQTLCSFSGIGDDGSNPYDSLLDVNGILYGTTFSGGSANKGTVYALTANITRPAAHNDSGRGIASHPIVIAAPGVLGNDDTGGDPHCGVVLAANPNNGTLIFHPDGSFIYTPISGYVGTDSFTYKAVNSAGVSNIATCTLSIGPIANNDSGRTYFNTAVTINAPGVLANDTTGGLTTTASLVTNPSHGTVTFNSNGSFTYTPTSGFLGTDSFTYKITSTAGTSAPATCTLTVQARTPVANNDNGRVTHNTTLTITAPGVLGNDNAGDTGTITTTLVTGPSHGTLTFNSNGSFVYKPTTGFIGTDSFTYKDANAIGTSNTATCTITVQ